MILVFILFRFSLPFFGSGFHLHLTTAIFLTAAYYFSGFGTELFLLFQPRGIYFFLSVVEISVKLDQLRNTLFNVIPFQELSRSVRIKSQTQFNTFTIVHFRDPGIRYSVRSSADAVFFFQKTDILIA